LAPPRRREVALLRAPIRKVFVPNTHYLVHAATIHAARQVAHLPYEVTKERGALPGTWPRSPLLLLRAVPTCTISVQLASRHVDSEMARPLDILTRSVYRADRSARGFDRCSDCGGDSGFLLPRFIRAAFSWMGGHQLGRRWKHSGTIPLDDISNRRATDRYSFRLFSVFGASESSCSNHTRISKKCRSSFDVLRLVIHHNQR
jgi:hypothetical protein